LKDLKLKLARSLWKFINGGKKVKQTVQAMKEANMKKTTFYKVIKQYESTLKKVDL